MILATYGIVIASFSLQNKYERDYFFEKTFLLANTNIDVVLKLLFFALSNSYLWFVNKKLEWMSYKVQNVWAIKKKVEIIDQKIFATSALES